MLAATPMRTAEVTTSGWAAAAASTMKDPIE